MKSPLRRGRPPCLPYRIDGNAKNKEVQGGHGDEKNKIGKSPLRRGRPPCLPYRIDGNAKNKEVQGGHGGPPLRKMKKEFDIRGRRSIRMKNWDYASPKYYFITLCVQNRMNLFGEILNSKMVLNEIGSMIKETWLAMHIRYSGITVDEYIVMPNHIHGILGLHVEVGLQHNISINFGESFLPVLGDTICLPSSGSASPEKSMSVSDMVRQFKTWTTKKYTENVIYSGWPEFYKRLWQRNYFERIVRHERELDQIRQYIRNNPANWQSDHENLVREGQKR